MTTAMMRRTVAMAVVAACFLGTTARAQQFEVDPNRDRPPDVFKEREELQKDSAIRILYGLDKDWQGDQAREVRQLAGVVNNGAHQVNNGVVTWSSSLQTWMQHSGYPGLSPWNWEFRTQGVVYTSDYLRTAPLTFTGSLENWSSSQLTQIDLDDSQLAAVFGDWYPGPAGRYAYYVVIQGVHFDAEVSMGPLALWASAEVVNSNNRPDSNNVLYIDLSSGFRGPANGFDYDITYTLELIGIDTRVWGVKKIDAPSYSTNTALQEYTDVVTVDLDGPVYWPDNDEPVFVELDDVKFWQQNSWINEMFVGLSGIGHDYDAWVGGDPSDGWGSATAYPYSAYEMDRWFSRVTILDYDSAAERVAVHFAGATHGYRGTLPQANRVFNMPHNMTSAYLFYCRYVDHAFVDRYTQAGSENP